MTSNPAPGQFATRAQHDATIPKDVQVVGDAAAPQGEQLGGATQREVGEFQHTGLAFAVGCGGTLGAASVGQASPASWASRAIWTRLLSSSFSSIRETCALTVATLM